MVSSIDCEKNKATLNADEINNLIERLAERFSKHWERYDLKLTWADAVRGDDSFAYWLQEHFNTFVYHSCKTEEDERELRFTLAIRYLSGYFSNQSWTDEKTERCALWRWMVCMGRHTDQDRCNPRTVASLTEAQIYCRAMVQLLGLDWTKDQIDRSCMSYVELNQRR